MKVFVLIPVFNRLAHTRQLLDCLRRQRGVQMQIVVIDDGSTDGTAEFLAGQPDVLTLKGNGQLWWAGAIDLALRSIHPLLQPSDFFVFMNNDTRIDDDFLSILVTTSLEHQRAVVGSAVRAPLPPHQLLSIGPRADLWNMAIWDVARDISAAEHEHPCDTYDVDFLPGRGTLFPGEVLGRIGYMTPWLLPHYHADYEFSGRARRAGFPLMVASRAVTYSTDEFGNQRKAASFIQRKFGKGSPENTLHKIAFFCLVGTPAQRLSAIPRMLAGQVDRWFHPIKLVTRVAAAKLFVRVAAAKFFARRAAAKLVMRGATAKIFARRAAAKLVGRRTATFPLHPWPHRLQSQVIERLGYLLAAHRSSVARARILAALERRGRRRQEALHAYAAGLLTELQQGTVLVLESNGQCHMPFFRRLGAQATVVPLGHGQVTNTVADLVFCALGPTARAADLPSTETLLQHVRPNGLLYCAHYSPAQAPDDISRLMDQLTQLPCLEVLVDGRNGWPPAARKLVLIPDGAFVGCHMDAMGSLHIRFLAVRRLW